jgi:hypothetical protein
VLVFNARHGQQDRSPTLSYRLNGNPAHAVTLVRDAFQIGNYVMAVPVDASELVAGTNTVRWIWTGTSGLPPAIGEVQLVWSGTGGAPTTTTTAPATTTTQTPTTTAAPTTTVAAPTTTQTPTTTAAPTTTQPPAGVAFSEDFATTAAFTSRFDHGWSGELHNGALFGQDRDGWMADHDMSCGEPNTTHREIHLGGGDNQTGQQNPTAADQAFFPCLPGGDPAKGHVMTTVNTGGYVIAWFSPKPTFTNVHKVCWDANTSDLGGGKWTQVVFLTATEIGSNSADLGFTSPEFQNNGGPSTERGSAKFGVRMGRNASIEAWQNGAFTNSTLAAVMDDNRAPRYQHCVTDNENGTLAVSIAQPAGTVKSGTITGQIPNGPIRVVFQDDNYNPDKHFVHGQDDGPLPAQPFYTWHWDNIQIS